MGIVSVQAGSSVAKGLFNQLSPGGAAFLRLAFAALVLGIAVRPQIRHYSRNHLGLAAAYGLCIAFMNFAFYSALARIPLGVAVTLEFVGPLAVAVSGSRHRFDVAWAALAGAGVLLLGPLGGNSFQAVGVELALVAGGFWAIYILLSARVGRALPGSGGLMVGMVAGTAALAPIGVMTAGSHLLEPRLLVGGALVALLSSVIPYSLELEALRSLPTRTFGVLMSLEPAVAAIIGFLALHQVLGGRALGAIILVSVASLGSSGVVLQGRSRPIPGPPVPPET